MTDINSEASTSIGSISDLDAGRRTFLAGSAMAALSTIIAAPAWARTGQEQAPIKQRFAQLEQSLQGRLGVFAIDTSDGTQVGHRANERFPVCSTFKFILAAAVLQRGTHVPALLARRIHYGQADLVTYAPITEKHLATGMTVTELIDAVLRYSDNAAANMLMKLLGGPGGVTSYARAIGNHSFRLDNWEPDLNSAPGDMRDTATPESMARSLQALVLGKALKRGARAQLQEGLVSSTTGATLIRAGVPADWIVGDKSGANSAYGTRNDIGVLWPNRGAPVILAVYTTRHARDAAMREDVVASAGGIVADWIKARR